MLEVNEELLEIGFGTTLIRARGGYLREDKEVILCAASNGPYEQQVNRLKIGKMYDYFKAVYVSESVGASKPSEKFFEYAFKDLESITGEKIKPDEALIIGDSITADMVGGADYGLKTCWYNRHKAQLPKKVDLDYVVERLEEVKVIL